MDRAKAKQQILNEKVFGPMVDKTFSDADSSKRRNLRFYSIASTRL